MDTLHRIKAIVYRLLVASHLDCLYRHLNRNKLLVVMYHGITRRKYNPPVWTQLPEQIFVEQLAYLKSNYNIISLSHLMACLQDRKTLPERSALITFDDGLRNNYDVAFPMLVKHSIPGAIFLATEFVDSERFFWFDELYFLLREAIKRQISLSDLNHDIQCKFDTADLADLYVEVVLSMKTMALPAREKRLDILRRKFDFDKESLVDDFGVMSWSQIREMNSSGLIEFGVHTANHRILQHLARTEWAKELAEPRQKLSRILGKQVLSFCYPNGRPGIDYEHSHINYLKQCGYLCAFTTKPGLNNANLQDRFQISRIPAGNDLTSDASFFRLNTAGFFDFLSNDDK